MMERSKVKPEAIDVHKPTRLASGEMLVSMVVPHSLRAVLRNLRCNAWADTTAEEPDAVEPAFRFRTWFCDPAGQPEAPTALHLIFSAEQWQALEDKAAWLGEPYIDAFDVVGMRIAVAQAWATPTQHSVAPSIDGDEVPF